MQTDPTIDPVADPAKLPVDDAGQQPRPAPGLPPDVDAPTPEPDEELADSELSDHERQQAIAREKWRREGRG